MKHLLSFSLILTFSLSLSAQTLAFPEAEGFGRYASGGRGGNVYYVTSLADCPDNALVEGTLRWALRDGADGDNTPRTVLFKVCGTIYLTSKLKLNHPNITIAGQTAPGGGICIAGANIYVCKPNVIIRHIRFRAGDIPSSNFPALDIENTKRVILDHCSFTWSMEECVTLYDADSTTMQYCIIGEGLYNSKHHKGARSYATQWGGEHSTMHHCLITNCVSRAPRFNGVRDEADLKSGKHNHDAQVVSEFVNNVIFNWGKANSLYGGECDTTKNRDTESHFLGYNEVYMENNWFQVGPTTRSCMSASSKYRFVVPSSSNGYGSWLLRGNRFSVAHALNSNNIPSDWPVKAPIVSTKRDSSYAIIQTAEEAYHTVCAKAGAQLPRLDEQDQRLLLEAADSVQPKFHGATKTTWLGIIDSQNDISFSREDYFYVGDSIVGGYPFLDALPEDSLVLDTDADGLPDAYEQEKGLDPNNVADGALLTSSGYSNLEIYLNGVATGTIDKTQYETLPYVSQQPNPPTALPFVLSPSSSPRKVLYQDHLYILFDNQIYTL